MYILHVSSLLKQLFPTKVLDSLCSLFVMRKQNSLIKNYESMTFDYTDTPVLRNQHFCSSCKIQLLSRIAKDELYLLD